MPSAYGLVCKIGVRMRVHGLGVCVWRDYDCLPNLVRNLSVLSNLVKNLSMSIYLLYMYASNPSITSKGHCGAVCLSSCLAFASLGASKAKIRS